MLIDKGSIEIERNGTSVKFIHRDEHGQPRRSLSKLPFQSAVVWKQAIEDWLSNYDEAMPLRRLDGSVVTVGAYESTVT